MLQKKLATALVVVFALSLSVLPSVTGQTAKKGGTPKSAARKGITKKGSPAGGPGAKLFAEHCSTCHEGGGNTIEANKTLKSADLKANGFNSAADVQQRIREGKAIMPAFEDQLKPAEIQAIAAYVWANSQKDWKK